MGCILFIRLILLRPNSPRTGPGSCYPQGLPSAWFDSWYVQLMDENMDIRGWIYHRMWPMDQTRYFLSIEICGCNMFSEEKFCLLFFIPRLKPVFAIEILLCWKWVLCCICKISAFTAGKKKKEKNWEGSQQKELLTFGEMSKKIGEWRAGGRILISCSSGLSPSRPFHFR